MIKMKFREYLEIKYERTLVPILVCLIALLFRPIWGLALLSMVAVVFVVAYFVEGRNLEYKRSGKEKKESGPYVYKWYYNRARVLRVIQVPLFCLVVFMGIIAGEFFSVLFYLSLMALFGVFLIYLSPRTITIEKIQETKVTDVFWWNRHNKEISKSTTHDKVLFLSYIIGMGILISFLGLALVVIETYRLIVMWSAMILSLSIVIELVFQMTYGFEDFEPKSIGEHLNKTEPQQYGLVKPKIDVVETIKAIQDFEDSMVIAEKEE